MAIAYGLRHKKITSYAPLLKIKINRVGCYGMRHVTDAVSGAVMGCGVLGLEFTRGVGYAIKRIEEASMKKIAILSILMVFIAGAAFSETTLPSESDYKELDELKVKIRRMKKEADGFIKELVAAYPDDGQSLAGGWAQDVKVDISETEKDVIVKADLPGMDKDKIEVTLDQGKMLKIAGSRDMVTNQAGKGFVRQERMQGSFSRVLELPAECMNEGIKASYNSGVLDIVIPKKPKAKDESVKIKIN